MYLDANSYRNFRKETKNRLRENLTKAEMALLFLISDKTEVFSFQMDESEMVRLLTLVDEFNNKVPEFKNTEKFIYNHSKRSEFEKHFLWSTKTIKRKVAIYFFYNKVFNSYLNTFFFTDGFSKEQEKEIAEKFKEVLEDREDLEATKKDDV